MGNREQMEWTTASEQIEGLSSTDLDSYLLDLVEVAVIAVDAQGTVFRWNRHAERIYGWPAGEAVGRRLVDLAIAPGNVRLAEGVMRTVVGGEVWDGDLPVLRKDGSAMTVQARIQPVHDAHGELMAMVGFSTDVTERRRSESERQRNEEELKYLARASAILDSSLDLPVTLQQLAELAVPFIGDGCMVDVRRQDGTIERFAAAAVNDPLREGFMRLQEHPIDPEGNHPIARAMRSGEPQLPDQIASEDRGGWASSAEHLEDLRRFPGRLCMVAPIKAGERLLGTLSIAMASERAGFGPRDVALVKELARRAATVLENARLYAERAYIAETLQQSLLPASLPDVEGFDLAAIYRPAAVGTEVGGDFYDVFETGSGGWGITIADVCGKGVEAAAVTSLARHTLRAAALHHDTAARMLETVNDALLRNFEGGEFCTMAVGVVETETHRARIQLALAGHPAPLILRANGTVEAVGESGSLLGVVPSPELHQVEVVIEPGDTLVLYTDGAIETRTRKGRLGQEGLGSILARCAGLSAMEVVANIQHGLDARRKGEVLDDLALLAMRFANGA
jgi:PAS domain S-box-containing protein